MYVRHSLNPNDTAALMLMWIVPFPPLPSPKRLTALTHRPPAWRIIRVLALAGNGIPAGRNMQLMYVRHSLNVHSLKGSTVNRKTALRISALTLALTALTGCMASTTTEDSKTWNCYTDGN